MLVLLVALAATLQISDKLDPSGTADVRGAARRMAEVEVVLGYNESGDVVCATRKSSGLPQIDAMICRDSAVCLKRSDATREQVNSCIEKRKPRLIRKIEKELKTMVDNDA